LEAVSPAALGTQRLVLEPVTVAHAEQILDYYVRNQAHLAPWEPSRPPRFYTVEYHREQCEKAVVARARDENARFAVFSREGGALVALFNLWEIRRGVIECAIIGYSVDEGHGGRGIATEAGAAVVDYGFGTLKLHRIETSYHPMNERSGRVLRKLGFAVQGYARDYLYMRGAWHDGILVARVNPDWVAPA
jgi:[ribosomal protein S5]-alanine N-acetyltransferase